MGGGDLTKQQSPKKRREPFQKTGFEKTPLCALRGSAVEFLSTSPQRHEERRAWADEIPSPHESLPECCSNGFALFPVSAVTARSLGQNALRRNQLAWCSSCAISASSAARSPSMSAWLAW